MAKKVVENKSGKELFMEEVKYIIAKIKRSKDDRVCHYSYLLKSTVETIKNMGIGVEHLGQHSYAFTVPDKRSSAWRKMCVFGKQRDEKGHFVKD